MVKYIFFMLLLITWLSDIGGYIIGKLIGKKKISYVSPNKTYLGFLGSILFFTTFLLFICFLMISVFLICSI